MHARAIHGTSLICLCALCASARAVTLGVDGTRFTLDGKPTFLLGISYYGGLGAPDETVAADLDDLAARGVNWIRVWATWTSGGSDVSAVDGAGAARQPYMDRLVRLVGEADVRGIVVDVTLTRGGGEGSVSTLDAHLEAVRTIARALAGSGNVYLDLANERNVGDKRYVPSKELGDLRDAVKGIDPTRLVTASQGGDISDEEIAEYVKVARVDFICPHRPRAAASPAQTEEATRRYLERLTTLGAPMPVHYQEPFRRDYGEWQPTAQDFLADLRAAVRGGAAGWCLHNGSPRRGEEGPARSFDLRPSQPRLMEQLDGDELGVVRRMGEVAAEAARG